MPIAIEITYTHCSSTESVWFYFVLRSSYFFKLSFHIYICFTKYLMESFLFNPPGVGLQACLPQPAADAQGGDAAPAGEAPTAGGRPSS